jgi:hypothetical protein
MDRMLEKKSSNPSWSGANKTMAPKPKDNNTP